MGFFVLVGLFILVGAIVAIGGRVSKATNPTGPGGLVSVAAIVLALVAVVLTTIFSSVHTVDNGHIGIVKQFGNLVGTTHAGLVTTAPWQSLASVSVRNELRTYDMDRTNSAVSSDSQPVFLKVQVNYSLQRAGAVQLYQNTGGQYVERILDPAVYQDVKEVTALYRAVEFAQNREQIRQQIEKKLQADVGNVRDEETKKPIPAIRINSVSLRNVDFTEALKQAIEQTVEANQNAKRAQAQVAIKEAEAKQAVAEATGEAQSNVARAEGEAKATLTRARADAAANRLKAATLNQNLLTQAAIDKLNPNVKVIVCESGKQCIPNAVLQVAGQ